MSLGPREDVNSGKKAACSRPVRLCSTLPHPPGTGRQTARGSEISRSALEGMGEPSDVLSGLTKHLELLLKPLGLGKI